MPWLLLVIAGLFEVCWAIGLKYTQGFTRPLPSALTIGAIVISLYLLSLSAKTLPIGTAYAVWVGIGSVGAAMMGMALLGEPATPARIGFLGVIVVGIVGLKVATP